MPFSPGAERFEHDYPEKETVGHLPVEEDASCLSGVFELSRPHPSPAEPDGSVTTWRDRLRTVRTICVHGLRVLAGF